jgi:molybdate transport system substrate-binding protein
MGIFLMTTLGVAQTLTVFAASSLTDAFEDIAVAFEADNPGVTVLLNVAGSSTLRTQIEQGAPADVFASANVFHMDALLEAGLVTEVQRFARNRLVVISQPEADIQTLGDMSREGVRLVIAAPQVPVGGYAREMLERLAARGGQALVDAILANVVSEELNVRQVASKVLLGEADAGVVYQSDALVFAELAVIPIADDVNVKAEYPIAIVRDASEVDVARAFSDFVLSEEGQRVLEAYGFLSVTASLPVPD